MNGFRDAAIGRLSDRAGAARHHARIIVDGAGILARSLSRRSLERTVTATLRRRLSQSPDRLTRRL